MTMATIQKRPHKTQLQKETAHVGGASRNNRSRNSRKMGKTKSREHTDATHRQRHTRVTEKFIKGSTPRHLKGAEPDPFCYGMISNKDICTLKLFSKV